ncbi:tetratricopeptide repeat protein [Allosphingosinicella sp.]|jgi:tetratricopeptide (TPR) repeat protein|uniref:tetratricopeptide repeat protein n=1 Tax=Allosphingosinicella sp. TaxID=2823234 RepID=UPI002F011850
MDAQLASPGQESRLERLVRFVGMDEGNLALLADAAFAAFDERDLETAGRMLELHSARAPLPPALVNLSGLVALEQGRLDEAAAAFEALLGQDGSDAQVRLNLAWTKSLQGDHESALALLDEGTLALGPKAAALRVRTLHHLGLPEQALEEGGRLAELRGADEDLCGALAIVALDAEDMEAARLYAQRSSATPEGQSALGLLQLSEDRIDDALESFDRALETRSRSPRALLGKGLALLAKGEAGGARVHLDRAAELFGDHLGSWVAAGWAHFVAGDAAVGRARFEKALAIDDSFAETHGALGVLDIEDGLLDSAKRRTETAFRLDRNCFSAALARSMLAERAGDAAGAARIRDSALNAPAGPGGKTIAQALAALGLGRR